MLGALNPEREFNEVTEELWQYIYARDNGICQNCGKAGDHVHHVVYKSLGGKNCANSLILLCFRCHDREHNICATRTVEYYLNRVSSNEKKFRERII